MLVLVTGPISSGTRLTWRMLDACPEIEAVHDNAHGFISPKDWPEDYDFIVIVTRETTAADASREARYQYTMSTEDQMVFINRMRDAVPTIDITYEDICYKKNKVIEQLATFLGVKPWKFSEKCVNQNDKWLDGKGGPEIGPTERPARCINPPSE